MLQTGKTKYLKVLCLLIAVFQLNVVLMAQEKVLSAKESDPKTMGWMQGFPPAEDKIVHGWDGSFFEFPALRWSVVHMREFLPTQRVSRGLEAPKPLAYQLDKNIDKVPFDVWDSNKEMTWKESLSENYTDGILILHQGKVVYEDYFGEMAEDEVHAVMSLTKSFTGTLAAILVAEGKLDPKKPVTYYIPELSESAFADATVREVMDMTTGLKYSEDYADPNAEIWQYSEAASPWPKPEEYSGPEGYYEYLQNVVKEGEHGEAFGYRTINADVLGWLVAKASDKSVTKLLSEKIWRKLGMEQDAYYQVDSKGIPFAGGGLSAGLRDLARFGELMRNKGVLEGEQIIPEAAVLDILEGGDKNAFKKAGYTKLKGWSYRDMWWMTENANHAYAARGVHGQTIYIDPTAEMVIVRFASHPQAGNAANDATSLPAYQAVADYLISK